METPEIKEILRVLGKTTAEIPRRETFHHRILAQCGSSIVTEPLCASRRDETKCFCCRGSLGSRAVSHPLWKSDRICVKCQQLPRCVACERRSSPSFFYLDENQKVAQFSRYQIGRCQGRTPLYICQQCAACGIIVQNESSTLPEVTIQRVLKKLKSTPLLNVDFTTLKFPLDFYHASIKGTKVENHGKQSIPIKLVDLHYLSHPSRNGFREATPKPFWFHNRSTMLVETQGWGENLVLGRCEFLEHPGNYTPRFDEEALVNNTRMGSPGIPSNKTTKKFSKTTSPLPFSISRQLDTRNIGETDVRNFVEQQDDGRLAALSIKVTGIKSETEMEHSKQHIDLMKPKRKVESVDAVGSDRVIPNTQIIGEDRHQLDSEVMDKNRGSPINHSSKVSTVVTDMRTPTINTIGHHSQPKVLQGMMTSRSVTQVSSLKKNNVGTVGYSVERKQKYFQFSATDFSESPFSQSEIPASMTTVWSISEVEQNKWHSPQGAVTSSRSSIIENRKSIRPGFFDKLSPEKTLDDVHRLATERASRKNNIPKSNPSTATNVHGIHGRSPYQTSRISELSVLGHSKAHPIVKKALEPPMVNLRYVDAFCVNPIIFSNWFLCKAREIGKFLLSLVPSYSIDIRNQKEENPSEQSMHHFSTCSEISTRSERIARQGRLIRVICLAEGLPEDLLASTLAHELVHVYIFATGYRLPRITEEGVCNAVCMLYIYSQLKRYSTLIQKLTKYLDNNQSPPNLKDLLKMYFPLEVEKFSPEMSCATTCTVVTEPYCSEEHSFNPFCFGTKEQLILLRERIILRHRFCVYRFRRMMLGDIQEYLAAVLILPLLFTHGLHYCLELFHRHHAEERYISKQQDSIITSNQRPLGEFAFKVDLKDGLILFLHFRITTGGQRASWRCLVIVFRNALSVSLDLDRIRKWLKEFSNVLLPFDTNTVG